MGDKGDKWDKGDGTPCRPSGSLHWETGVDMGDIVYPVAFVLS